MTKLTAIVALAAISMANGECPNACSGHGICVQYDMCQCYRNWQSNDCSERTCAFGYAHVDSPLGDMDMSGGELSEYSTTVIAGSEVYPMGTKEQYPDALTNEAHFYMECSNKGLCDRKTGDCECFDGYDGAACERASCPGGHGGSSEQCSGHGTCHSIATLTEKGSYTGLPLEVRDLTQTYYGLWDKNSTRGCSCDAPYVGADCSSRACKVGIDPLFSGYATHNEPMVVLDCLTNQSPTGTFTLLFTDSFGQEYRTSKLAATATATEVKNALLALPNGVVPEVDVLDYSSYTSGSSTDYAFIINFPRNPGARAALQVDGSDLNCGSYEGDATYNPKVGFRHVGEDAETYTYHATDIAFAKNGHRLIYIKSSLPSNSVGAIIKIEKSLYVVEATGDVGDFLSYVVLHVPFEGEDVDGDSEEQDDLLAGIAASQVVLTSDGHLDNIFFTDDDGSGDDISSGSDLDGDGAEEAKQPILGSEYFLVHFQTKDWGFDSTTVTSWLSSTTDPGEYCIIKPQSKTTVDQTSSSTTQGSATIGGNLAAASPEGTALVGLQLELDGFNCPIGYKGLQYTTDGGTGTDGSDFDTAGFIPTRVTRFYLTREGSVSTKYQSTHAAAGGAYLKSAYNRITSQTARGTTRVYLTSATGFQTATLFGDASSLGAVVGSNVVSVSGSSGTLSKGDVVLVGTEKNVVSEDADLSNSGNINLQNLFVGSGEGQVSGADTRDGVTNTFDIDNTDTTHLVSFYKIDGGSTLDPYDYVLECSGRGNCDSTTGTCKCFKGYTNDNCDSQSTLFNGK